MAENMTFGEIKQTVFLRPGDGGLEQLVRVAVSNPGSAPVAAAAVVEVGGRTRRAPLGEVAAGESTHEVFLDEPAASVDAVFALEVAGEVVARKTVKLTPPRHWKVHVVHLSHHDAGYTDLASHAVAEHDLWLDRVIDIAAATRDFPEEARFRIVVEQAWSIDHFLNHAPPERAAAMVKLLQAGDVEVTALFGNMTSELCDHEALARCTYHAFRLARRYGLEIVSAEHNDVPGFAWGLAEVLAGTGVKIFCPGLPLYWQWSGQGFPGFWDEQAIFGAKGVPGAFWWEAPSGKRVLLWCNNWGCGGDIRPSLPSLAGRLAEFEQKGYAHDVIRWPVGGGGRDNAPYIEGYAHTVRDWNATWAWPHLELSTNARFYDEFIGAAGEDLPTHRGDLPGQDYPVGATSTAAATAVNRNNHADLPVAEALATVADALTDYPYQADRLFQAYEHVIWHDEHTWGHHFPCGPTAEAAEMEKALHARRAAALAHDVANKAMARIADHVRLDKEGIHLVVFNPLPRVRTGPVAAPLREIDNCGSEMISVNDSQNPGLTFLGGALLGDRWHVNPPMDLVEGRFDLVDADTGDPAPYQIVEVDSPMGPESHAAQRLGIAAGGKRYGGFETPRGLKRFIRFLAEDVPAMGYRTYRLAPREDRPTFPGAARATGTALENEYYRIEVDPAGGAVSSIFDKELGRELVDPAAEHPFGTLVVGEPDGAEHVCTCRGVDRVENGPLVASLRIRRSAVGHPVIEQTVGLQAGVKRIEFAVWVLKDPTPLLTASLAFPFDVPGGRFRTEGPWAVVDPPEDLLPGAFANRLTVQNWVAAAGPDVSVLWSSRDAPIASLARLWRPRVSPAHASVVQDNLADPPQRPEDLRGGRIYSCLFANNFGTNFSASQCGDVLFRYTISSAGGRVSDAAAAAFGQEAARGLTQIFTKHPRTRPLPPRKAFLEIDPPAVQLTALKRAEDGRGRIVRLWNLTDAPVETTLRGSHGQVQGAIRTDLAERDLPEAPDCQDDTVRLTLSPREVATLRIL